ncbi:hypothetical protein [Burkholderia sp. Ac-20349]|uniref:hypothetical protein n=1 Tax=Burkholderia sp. Ac-20349 TaxID=2703893 RepID=UPI001F120DA1|nr:hypothetical protein [Burkholderia sp. Ac-20349]
MKSRSQTPSPNSKTSIDPAIERAVLKAKCERDHLFFSRYFFKHRQSIKFRVNWHHMLIADAVQRVIDGKLKNVVINVPPGSSKTELVAINLIARGLALNPRARFLHISYSDDLALLNSEAARDIVASSEYQALWPLVIADDAKSKKRWNVLVNGKKAGGVYAVSLGGQITGFRAGHMAEGWQGAIVIDDPLKVEDAYSKTNRNKANRKLLSTVKSRKANPDTPIIVIMQRLAEEDPTGFIKSGKLPGDWEFIEIPALIADEYVAKLQERERHRARAPARLAPRRLDSADRAPDVSIPECDGPRDHPRDFGTRVTAGCIAAAIRSSRRSAFPSGEGGAVPEAFHSRHQVDRDPRHSCRRSRTTPEPDPAISVGQGSRGSTCEPEDRSTRATACAARHRWGRRTPVSLP